MTSRGVRSLLVLLLVCLAAVPVCAQQQETPPPEPQQTVPAPASPDAAEPPNPPNTPVPSGAGGAEAGAGDAEAPPAPPDRILPRVDLYFPENELDLRVSRLINNTFFEGQVKYDFIGGDITAFLRYRYYGYKRTTQFTVFDAIEFDDIDEDISDDFDRVRGTLVLLQWPHSYSSRTFGLVELDRISSNKSADANSEFFVRRDRTNPFVRLGYQLGTPDDGRSSAIAGETRARTERLFSAFREFGPGDATFTAALTYGFEYGVGDFDYVKFEFEALKRFDASTRTFLIGRMRGGTFPHVGKTDPATLPPNPDPIDFFAVPSSEVFRLDGRENLKGLDERLRGLEQLLTTWEYFFPWFLDSHRSFMRLDFNNWYWVLYTGIGTIGLDREVYTDFDSYIPDVGIGFESSVRLRKYRFFLSGIVAQALKGDGGLEARISVKSYR